MALNLDGLGAPSADPGKAVVHILHHHHNKPPPSPNRPLSSDMTRRFRSGDGCKYLTGTKLMVLLLVCAIGGAALQGKNHRERLLAVIRGLAEKVRCCRDLSNHEDRELVGRLLLQSAARSSALPVCLLFLWGYTSVLKELKWMWCVFICAYVGGGGWVSATL
jgi:hypothetical protein